jgi:beta-glucosidase
MKKAIIIACTSILSIGTLATQAGAAASATPGTCIAKPRASWWPGYHKAMLKREPKNMKVMFLGDSITMMWRTQSGYEGGSKVWDRNYKQLNAGNYGISGDKTENVLWRITKSNDLQGTNPKVVVLLIGINNLLQKDSPEDTAAGIKKIVSNLRKKLPQSKILLMGVFPCWKSPKHPIRAKVKKVNASISSLADNKHIWFLDIGNVFLEKDGSISKTILRDYLHLSEKGYERWAKAMNPKLLELLN